MSISKPISIVGIFFSLSYPVMLAASQHEQFQFSNLRANAEIQWELARNGCHVGPVDGIIRLSGRQSLAEKCLTERGIKILQPDSRIMAELYLQGNNGAFDRFDLAAIREAMSGLFVPEDIPRRMVRPNREDRARAARESLGTLHPSRLLLFLLVGMDMDSQRIRTLSKTLLDREKLTQVQPELWELTLKRERVTNGIAYFLKGLDNAERERNTQALLHYARSRDIAVNGDELLAAMIGELWAVPAGMGEKDYSVYLQPLVALLLNELDGKDGNGTIDEACMSAILRQFGNRIFGPLVNHYLVVGDYSKAGKRILDFIQQQDQVVPAVKSISAKLNGSTDDFQLLRLLHRITPDEG
jgi:hypothetical protein